MVVSKIDIYLFHNIQRILTVGVVVENRTANQGKFRKRDQSSVWRRRFSLVLEGISIYMQMKQFWERISWK